MVLYLLAETDKEKAQAVGYLLLFGIALAGLIGVLILLGLMLLRRYTRRRLAVIEQDQTERRKASSVGRVDAWSAGSDRYVDQDKLPDDVPYDTHPDSDDTDPDEIDADEDVPPPGWDDSPPDDEQDPYGLFDDKPYRETDDDQDDDDGDEDWDDADEDDGRR